MKKLAGQVTATLMVAGVLVLGSGQLIISQPAKEIKCGEYRQLIKTASDSAGRIICLMRPRVVEAFQITETALPTLNHSIRNGWENVLVQTQVIYLDSKKEADGDIHLICKDFHSNPLDIEIPDTCCVENKSIISDIKESRAFALTLKPGDTITFVGIPFYDKLHGSTGASPIGLEFHPLLKFIHK